MTKILGNISSIESGFVDGPGVRVVVYLQGCPLRCLYCHNPETWNDKDIKLQLSPQQLLQKIKRYEKYFGKDGGVTFSGGEPLGQPQFLLECLKLCKQCGYHTAIDTSGVGKNFEEVLNYVDLVILDVKAVNDKSYTNITGAKIENFYNFLNVVQEKKIPLWLRQVVVPGINDTQESVLELKKFANGLKNVEKIELLAYHDMAKEKYEKLGIKYRLKNTQPMQQDKLDKLDKFLH